MNYNKAKFCPQWAVITSFISTQPLKQQKQHKQQQVIKSIVYRYRDKRLKRVLSSNKFTVRLSTSSNQHNNKCTTNSKKYTVSQKNDRRRHMPVAYWKDNFRVHVFLGSAETLVRRGGIINHHWIAYSLSNISAKKYWNRLMWVESIVCKISVVFFGTQCTSKKPQYKAHRLLQANKSR